ncbi:MAG: APC family permease [Puniceicoccales bacterium]|jgi:amino acid transporter|nr:APC family permease [Puniceicoccales bacterium]
MGFWRPHKHFVTVPSRQQKSIDSGGGRRQRTAKVFLAVAAQKKSIGVFALTMINLAAIMSLRNFTLMAPYGLAMVAMFAIAIVCFFIPTAMISAELAAATSEEGGAYVWIRDALGAPAAFFCEWICFATTIASITMTSVFLSSSMAIAICPEIGGGPFIFFSVSTIIWVATILCMRGMALTSRIVSLSTILGSVLPSIFLIGLGIHRILSGNSSAMEFSARALLPNLSDFSNISFLAGLMFAFAGIEMSSYYVNDVKNPRRTFPKAVLISAATILLLFVLGSLSIAVTIAPDKIKLEAGVMQALAALLDGAHMKFLVPLFGFLIIFGAVAYIFAWIAGPVRGLYAVRHAGFLPPLLQKTDRNGLPVALMLLQAVAVTAFATLFLVIPSTGLCFWIINASSSLLILIFYGCLFLSGAILRRRRRGNGGHFTVPGGLFGTFSLAAIGLANVAFCCAISIFLPRELSGQMSPLPFAASVALAALAMACPPAFFIWLRKPNWKPIGR